MKPFARHREMELDGGERSFRRRVYWYSTPAFLKSWYVRINRDSKRG